MDNQEYVDRLGRVLVGSRAAKRDLLREVADHLEDATEARVADGVDPAEAARLARADFGSVAALSPAYQATLAAALLRRSSTVLTLVLVAQPLAWTVHRSAPAADHPWLTVALNQVVDVVGLSTIALALLALAVTGIGTRWWGVHPGAMRAAATATLTASTVIVGISATMVGTGAGPTAGNALFALGVVGLPFGWVAWQSGRCLRALAAGPEVAA